MSTKTKKPKKINKTVTKKIDEKTDEPLTRRNEAIDRAERCNAELAKILQHHGCVIQPYIVPSLEPVGQRGDCMQISASYGIRALPKETQ